MVTLQEIIDAVNAGTPEGKLAFKNLIVDGLNSQDLADIITGSTDAHKIELAKMIVNADSFLQNQLRQQEQADRQAHIDTATAWWTNSALPTLFNPITSRDEAKQNYIDIEDGIKNQTDEWRITVLRQKLEDANNNFRLAKSLEEQNQPVSIQVV